MLIDDLVSIAAADGGHIDVLQWARSQDPPCPWDEYVCRYAAMNGHLDVLQWARSQDPYRKLYYKTLIRMLKNNLL